MNRFTPIPAARASLFTILALTGLLVISGLGTTVESSSTDAFRSNSLSNAALRSAQPGFSSAPAPFFAALDVDTTADDATKTACTVAPNDCSLRGAILDANSLPGTVINVPSGTYSLTLPGTTDQTGDLDIRGNATSIVGAGAATTIIQQTITDRVLDVNPGNLAGFSFSISGVTIKNGLLSAGAGAGMLAGGAGSSVTITDCAFTNNIVNTSFLGNGGAISFTSTGAGDLTISGSSFTGNKAAFGVGGAIRYSAAGTLTVDNSSFTNNEATRNSGGAINVTTPTATGTYIVRRSSFDGNRALSATGRGGAIAVVTGNLLVNYSRLVNNISGAGVGDAISRSVGAAGTSDVDNNWWGINTGPSATALVGGPVATTWLQLRHVASPNTVCAGGVSSLTADILGRNAGGPTAASNLTGLPPFTATFNNAVLGVISAASPQFVDGVATATYTAGSTAGSGSADARADSQTQTAAITITGNTTSDPLDQAVCEGATATFSTAASGPGTISFVWKQGATVLTTGDLGGRVTVSSAGNSSTLTITNVQPGDGANYTVEATGDCSTASQSATLTINATAASDPTDQTVCQGTAGSFSTTASGTGPFSYAWKVDGSSFGGNTSSINVPTGSLSIGSHTVDVTVTGACGNSSQSATLTVQENTATSDPADATVCQGATANFSSTATGTGPFTYAWTVDGSAFGGNTSSISVPSGALSVGSHSVGLTTTGTCGSASQSATLTVQENTSATTPGNQTICQGGTANFSTTASGTGPFTYQWKLDGNNIAGATNNTVGINTTALSGGSHTVDVVVGGTCGSVTKSATLTVNTTPVVTTNPVSQTISSGNVTFTAAASGLPAPTVQWEVSTNGGGSFSPIPGATSTSLTFATNPSQNGNQYRAVFTNTCGTATSSAATLTTCTPAAIVTNPVSVVDACVGAVVNFTASASGFPTPTVQWQVSTNGGGSFANISGATSTTLSVTASVAVRNNQYRAVFTNDCGTATSTAAILGVDTIAPVITLNGQTISLWPPNHSYHTVNVTDLVASASDNCNANLLSSVVIASVSSDEPENGGGDGNTFNDIVIGADCKSVQLRAERVTSGNGRVYRITFKVTDSAGNTTTVMAKVSVPTSQNGAAAIDDGPGAGYTVNGACP